MLEVTEYFVHQLFEADWLTGACDSRCAEAYKTKPPSFMLVTSVLKMKQAQVKLIIQL
jgi:hypothetical protein